MLSRVLSSVLEHAPALQNKMLRSIEGSSVEFHSNLIAECMTGQPVVDWGSVRVPASFYPRFKEESTRTWCNFRGFTLPDDTRAQIRGSTAILSAEDKEAQITLHTKHWYKEFMHATANLLVAILNCKKHAVKQCVWAMCDLYFHPRCKVSCHMLDEQGVQIHLAEELDHFRCVTDRICSSRGLGTRVNELTHCIDGQGFRAYIRKVAEGKKPVPWFPRCMSEIEELAQRFESDAKDNTSNAWRYRLLTQMISLFEDQDTLELLEAGNLNEDHVKWSKRRLFELHKQRGKVEPQCNSCNHCPWRMNPCVKERVRECTRGRIEASGGEHGVDRVTIFRRMNNGDLDF